MNVLCIGDVVADEGLAFLQDRLPGLKRDTAADFVIVNGENSDKGGKGLSRESAAVLLRHADVVTGGNHSLRRLDKHFYADEENERVLMPANYPFTSENAGCCIIDTGRSGAVRVICLSGLAWMESLDNPFAKVEQLLAAGEARYTIVDFHAQSSAEKKALAFYLDGRVSAFFGTHTHVQTADEQVLPRGTGYITDVGMTGAYLSVIGVEPEGAIKKQREQVPVAFRTAKGPQMMNAVLFTLEDETGLCVGVERINLRESVHL